MIEPHRDYHLSSPEAFDAAYAEAIDLVHTFRAASISLLQRRLRIDNEAARRLMEHMARETTFVLPKPGGLYVYVSSSIGTELASLRGFAQLVIRALQNDDINPEALHAEAMRRGLTTEVIVDSPCSPTCVCAKRLDFPARCVRPATHDEAT